MGGRTTSLRPCAASPASMISMTFGIAGISPHIASIKKPEGDTSHANSPGGLLCELLELAGVEIIDLVDEFIGVGGFHIEVLGQ